MPSLINANHPQTSDVWRFKNYASFGHRMPSLCEHNNNVVIYRIRFKIDRRFVGHQLRLKLEVLSKFWLKTNVLLSLSSARIGPVDANLRLSRNFNIFVFITGASDNQPSSMLYRKLQEGHAASFSATADPDPKQDPHNMTEDVFFRYTHLNSHLNASMYFQKLQIYIVSTVSSLGFS
jgi:hypothetical protein